MLKSWLVFGALGVALVGCTTDSPPPTGTGGTLTATGGLITATGGTVVDNGCGNDGVTADAYGCGFGLSCVDVLPGIGASLGFPTTYCSCPATARPPMCDAADPTSCAAFPGSTCTMVPTLGSFCTQACTLPPAEGTGGVVTGTGGELAGTGGSMTGTGGVPAADACVNDPTADDGSGCSPGLVCATLAAGLPASCNCPKTGFPPACTEGGAECAAFPMTACTDLPTGGKGCLGSCTPPGSQPIECPGDLTCLDLGAAIGISGAAVCVQGIFPVPCTVGGSECAAYPGTNCSPNPIDPASNVCLMLCTP